MAEYKTHFKKWCKDTGRFYGSPHLSTLKIEEVTCKTCIKKYNNENKKTP